MVTFNRSSSNFLWAIFNFGVLLKACKNMSSLAPIKLFRLILEDAIGLSSSLSIYLWVLVFVGRGIFVWMLSTTTIHNCYYVVLLIC